MLYSFGKTIPIMKKLAIILAAFCTAFISTKTQATTMDNLDKKQTNIVRAAAFVIPGCLAGYFANNLFLPGAGEFFAAAISSVISLGVPLILFYVFGMLDFDGKNQPAVRRERTRFSTGKKAKRSA